MDILNESFNMSLSGLNNNGGAIGKCESSEIKQQEKQKWQVFELNFR
jgi:hypothetical protein